MTRNACAAHAERISRPAPRPRSLTNRTTVKLPITRVYTQYLSRICLHQSLPYAAVLLLDAVCCKQAIARLILIRRQRKCGPFRSFTSITSLPAHVWLGQGRRTSGDHIPSSLCQKIRWRLTQHGTKSCPPQPRAEQPSVHSGSSQSACRVEPFVSTIVAYVGHESLRSTLSTASPVESGVGRGNQSSTNSHACRPRTCRESGLQTRIGSD